MGCSSFLQNPWFQIPVFLLGTVAGMAAFAVFWKMQFMYASILGGIAGIYAGTLAAEISILHIWKHRNKSSSSKHGSKIETLPETRIAVVVKFVIAVSGVATGIGFMVYLLISGLTSGARFDSPLYMGAIQSWMLLKWSLSWVAHLYRYHPIKDRKLTEEEEGLWEEEE